MSPMRHLTTRERWKCVSVCGCVCVIQEKNLRSASHGSIGIEKEAVGHCVVTFSG